MGLFLSFLPVSNSASVKLSTGTVLRLLLNEFIVSRFIPSTLCVYQVVGDRFLASLLDENSFFKNALVAKSTEFGFLFWWCWGFQFSELGWFINILSKTRSAVTLGWNLSLSWISLSNYLGLRFIIFSRVVPLQRLVGLLSKILASCSAS